MTSTKSSLILAVGLALVAMPLASAGQHGDQTHEAMFKKMDTNGDGKVTRVEHTAGAKLMFSNLDANRDGQVTATEMTAAQARMKTEREAIADTSVRTGTAATPAPADKPAKANPPGTTDSAAATAKAVKSNEEVIKKNDTDKDGRLSAAEFNADSDAMFTKADTNHDDALTLEECTAGGMMKH